MSSAEASMQFLVERLRWPIRMVRWRAAQEIATLLGSKRHRNMALGIYFDWLERRAFESETASGLSVLLCASENVLPPVSQLISHIAAPSVLADVILQSIYGVNVKSGKWELRHSGRAPDSFDAPSFFLKYQKSHVPPALTDTLERLSEISHLNFCKQWAFEWEQLMELTNCPYSGFPYWFMDNTDRQKGVFGQFSQRQCDVYRSAYLRTLSFGVSIGMPVTLAQQISVDTLPLSPDFARTRPISRPDWLGEIPDAFFKNGGETDTIVHELVSKIRKHSGRELLSLKTPVSKEIAKYSALSVQAVLASDDFEVDSTDNANYIGGVWWNLGTSGSFEHTIPDVEADRHICAGKTGSCVPLSFDIWPIPAGFWQNDYFQCGVSFPVAHIFDDVIRASCRSGAVDFSNGDCVLGQWQVWHDQWSPLYPKDGSTRCGMLTTLVGSVIEAAAKRFGRKLGWIVERRLWKSEKDYDELVESVSRSFTPALDQAESARGGQL